MSLKRSTSPGAIALAAALLAAGCSSGGGGSSKVNHAPLAVAGVDQLVQTGSIVHLDGSGSSDPDLDSLTFQWTLAATPLGSHASLVGGDGAMPGFIPDVAGDYLLRLVVDDGHLASAPDTVLVQATGASRPIASAGPDQVAVTGQTAVRLDASGSRDPDGGALYYTWIRKSFPSGSTAVLDTNVPAQPTFLPDRSGVYVFGLQVNDGVNVSDWDEVTVTASAQADVAITGGDGQSGVVATLLSQPLTVKVTNGSGLPVRSVTIEFSTADGSGTFSRTSGYTDASGQTSATLTLGTSAGPKTVRATCTSCTGTVVATTAAMALPDVPARVSLLEPVDAHVGSPMTLAAEVQDRYGNLATGDTGTRFTVSASGAATFASASQGSIVSGAGTASALVLTSGGRIDLQVADATAETVSFVAADSEHTGLAFVGSAFHSTATQQALACSSPYLNTFSFDVSRARPPTGDATLRVRANGNFDDGTFDYLEVLLEAATGGASYGRLYDSSSSLCTALDRAVTVPLASLQTYVADGKVGVVTRAAGGACIFCSAAYSVVLDLDYPMTTQGAFY